MSNISMKKVVIKQGNSLVVVMDKQDKRIYGIKEGDIIDIDINKVVGHLTPQRRKIKV